MLTRFLRLLAASALLTALVLVPAAAVSAGGGCHGTDGSVHTEGTATVVRMDVCSFAPTVTHVAVGTEVRFLNTAALVHVVAGERSSWGSDGELAPGAETSQRFDRAGVYPFSCPLHPGMVGAVVVGEPDPAGAAAVAASAAASDTATGGIPLAAGAVIGIAGVVAGLLIAVAWLRRTRREASTAVAAP